MQFMLAPLLRLIFQMIKLFEGVYIQKTTSAKSKVARQRVINQKCSCNGVEKGERCACEESNTFRDGDMAAQVMTLKQTPEGDILKTNPLQLREALQGDGLQANAVS